MTDSKRPYHHPDLRNALIDAALASVDRDGHEKLSLRALAAHLAVSATAPQAHFASKQALLMTLAERGFCELRLRLEDCDLEGEAVEVFTALARAYLQFATERRGLYRLMFGADINLDGDAALTLASEAAFNVLREAVRRHRTKSSTAQTIETKALIAWSVVHGLAHICLDGSTSSRLRVDLNALPKEKEVAKFIVESLNKD